MIKLIDRYGIEIVKKEGKNCYYSPELKQEIIDKVLLESRSQIKGISRLCSSKSLECCIIGWHNIRKTGILLLRKQEEGYLKWDVSQRRNLEEMTELERLQAENEYLRAENAVLKS